MTNKEEKYKNYLEQHIANVKRAFDFLMVKIGGDFKPFGFGYSSFEKTN